MVVTEPNPLTLEQIPWPKDAFIEPTSNPALEKKIAASLGLLPDLMRYVLRLPWLVDAEVLVCRYTPVHFRPEVGHMLGMVISQENSCRYCYGAYRALFKMIGFSANDLREIESNLLDPDPKQQALLGFVRRLARSHPRVMADEMAALQAAGFKREAVIEAVFIASMLCFRNRIGTLLAIPPDALEKNADSVLVKLMRPLIRWKMKRPTAAWAVPVPSNADIPFAPLSEALSGLEPAQTVLRTNLHLAWNSNVISSRAKALIFAVVAKGLGCQACETGSRALLEREGFTSDEAEQVLTHLASPKLNALESKLVRFARQTVHYRTDVMHEGCREMFEGLLPEQVLEIVGVTALANWIARLSVLLGK